jgi:hypothetical protein
VSEEEFTTAKEAQAAKHVVIQVTERRVVQPRECYRSCVLYSAFATFVCFFILAAGGMFAELP